MTSRRSVRELKAALDAAGIDYSLVVEREELEWLVAQQQEQQQQPQPQQPQQQQQQQQPQQHAPGSGKSAQYSKLMQAAQVLGVSLDCSEDALAAAHKHALRNLHPDRNASQHAEEQFKEARAAYDTLSALGHAKRIEWVRAAQRKREHDEQRQRRRLEQQQQQQPAIQQQQAMLEQQQQLIQQQRRQMQQQQQQQQQRTPQHHHQSGPSPGPHTHATHTPVQFQDVLAAAARENASRMAPSASVMARELPSANDDGDEGGSRTSGDGVGGLGGQGGRSSGGRRSNGTPPPASSDESPLIILCIDAMSVCAHCYLISQTLLSRCVACVWDCGGLLRVSDKEMRSWGFREHEQPARYRVSEREARQMRQELNAAHQASKRSAMMNGGGSTSMGAATKAGTYVV